MAVKDLLEMFHHVKLPTLCLTSILLENIPLFLQSEMLNWRVFSVLKL